MFLLHKLRNMCRLVRNEIRKVVKLLFISLGLIKFASDKNKKLCLSEKPYRIMNHKAELYRKCHQTLTELDKFNQIPLYDIDREVKKRLISDNAISINGLDVSTTSKGNVLFLKNYYIELAEETESKEREKELRERDSFINQRLVEETIKQTKIGWDNRKTQFLSLVISGISLIVSILSFVYSCTK